MPERRFEVSVPEGKPTARTPADTRRVLMVDLGFRSAAIIAGLAGIGGLSLERIIDSVMPKGPAGKYQERSGPPILKGKRLERLKRQSRRRDE